MPSLIGNTLGPYRIIEQIGLGGMATVYKAYQPAMDRYVALKVLSIHLAQDPTFIKRFAQEAKVIARLEHAHILPVYDHGKEEDYLYLVMRFIEAGTLKERLADAPLSLAETRRIVTQVGSALEYAHRQGIIHRDLKPSNVLVDREGDCYLTDFGIAKMVEGTMGLTGSGIIGTPHYMAPEQGQSAQVDRRTDIYAMGVVIYEMVTGRVPFDAETPFAVVMKHMTEPLPLPRQVRPELPEAVERVILKAMAKSPADRYQSMRDLVAAFGQAAQETVRETVPAAPASSADLAPTETLEVAEPPTLAAAPPTRLPAWLLAAAGLALVLLVVAGIILSRIPSRVEVSGGSVELAPPAATDTPQAQPTALSAAQATATTTPHPTPSPTPTLRPTPSPTPMPSPTPSPTPMPIPAPPQEGKELFACPDVTPFQLCVHDFRTGQVSQLTQDLDFKGDTGIASWSPDGQRIAFSAALGRPNLQKLYVINADGSNLTRISDGDTYDHEVAWSPGGEWIAFHRACGLWIIRPDGSDAQALIEPRDKFCAEAPAWSPDSQQIALMNIMRGVPSEIWVVNRDGSQPRLVYSFGLAVDGGGVAWSPDGRQIGCWYHKGGNYAALLVNADGGGQAQAIQEIPYWWRASFWPQWGRPAPAPTPTPPPDFVRPGARGKYALAEIVPLLDTVEKLHLFMQNNMGYIAELKGVKGYCHPSIIYEKGGDDCAGLSIFARYVLEQHGYQAWHMGIDNHAPWGKNVVPYIDKDGQMYYLEDFAVKKGPYNSFQDIATAIIPNWQKIWLYGPQPEGCQFPEIVQEITPSPTQIPTPTLAPTDTPTPSVSSVYMNDDGKGHRWCEPDTVRAGRIVVRRGIGRWPTPEEARAAVGDSWPPITANGQALVVTGLERSDVEWHATRSDDPTPGWGFHANVEIQLGPGVYSLSSLWLFDLKDCTLTVTEP